MCNATLIVLENATYTIWFILLDHQHTGPRGVFLAICGINSLTAAECIILKMIFIPMVQSFTTVVCNCRGMTGTKEDAAYGTQRFRNLHSEHHKTNSWNNILVVVYTQHKTKPDKIVWHSYMAESAEQELNLHKFLSTKTRYLVNKPQAVRYWHR